MVVGRGHVALASNMEKSMSKDSEPVEEIGPTCLYKNGNAQTFEGSKVTKMMKDGWKDTPQPVEEAPAKLDPRPERRH